MGFGFKRGRGLREAFLQVVNFVCQVRGKHTQTIMLSNRTHQPWTLRPIIEGEQWKGAEFLRVEAHQQNKPYEVTYRPLTMTVENKKDQVWPWPRENPCVCVRGVSFG